VVFPPKRENVHLDAVEDDVALICPIGSLWHWFGAFCVAKNGTKTGGQRDIEVGLKVICINFTALNIRICT
jgi:hypothetical protein